jgi:hypothetical protein
MKHGIFLLSPQVSGSTVPISILDSNLSSVEFLKYAFLVANTVLICNNISAFGSYYSYHFYQKVPGLGQK